MSQAVETLKILLVGSTSAGKTSLITSYKNKNFNDRKGPTIGVDMVIEKNVEIGLRMYNFAIWDTAGQEAYRSITRLSCKDADAAIVCFDLNNPDSASALMNWVEFIQTHCPLHIYIVIVGTKSDLGQKYNKEELQTIETQIYTRYNTKCQYFETSAKTCQGLDELFRHVFENAVSNKQQAQEAANITSIQCQTPRLNDAQTQSITLSNSRQRMSNATSSIAIHRSTVEAKNSSSYCC